MRTPGHYPPKKPSVAACTAILFLIAMVLSPLAESAPLLDFPVTVKQPDGIILHLYVSGDEHYNRLHDKEGYTIIQDPVTGYYVYAVSDPSGDLVSSGHAVGSVHPKTTGLEKGIKQSPEKMREQVATDHFFLQRSLHEGREPILAPKTGTINNLVVFVRFGDEAEFTDALNTYDAMFNNAAAGANSMANYFREVSYEQLSISTTFYPIPVLGNVRSYQDSHPRAYYQPYNAATNPSGYQNVAERIEREEALVKSAVNAIATLVLSSLNVDEDNDGNVDNICFIVYGAPDAGGQNVLLWPHKRTLDTKEAYLNDKRVWTYNIQLQAALSQYGVGVLAHEMLHSIGFPDLYRYYFGGHPAWQWDIMDKDLNPPQHPLAYMKHRYGGWIDAIPTITTPGTYTLKPLTSATNNAYRINSPYTSDEYFLVEYRRKTGPFDGNLPGEGLLVYRINRTRAGQGNANGPPDEVYVYRPTKVKDAPENAAFSSNAGRTAIYDGTDPSPSLFATPGGLYLYDISAIADTISFTVAFPPFLAKTGQTQSYATGDDGEMQSGIVWPDPRFTVLSGVCIQDNLTGLLWTKRGNLPAKPSEWQQLWWGDAIDYAKSLTWCDCSTWRLPNINELESLLNIGSLSPYSWLYGQGFSDIGAATFWSSTARAVDAGTQNPTAWTHEFFNGKMAWALKGTWDYTWPVCGMGTDGPGKLLRTGQEGVDRAGDDGTYRAGRPWDTVRYYEVFCNDNGLCPTERYVDCDTNDWNNLVIDGTTGLIWTRYASSIGLPAPCNKSIFKNWQNALDYIQCLNDNEYLGFKDWRLPNKNELRSLIDYSKWSPATQSGLSGSFIGAGGNYWSSTTVGTGGEQTKAVLVDLTHGQTTWALKTNSTAGYGVWPVRTAKAKVPNAILSVTKAGVGQGTVTSYPAGIACGPTCTFSFDAGQAVTLSASASPGSAFSGWSGCDSLTGNNCNVTMDDDRGVTANFAVPTYLLTVNRLGQGSGTVTSSPFGIDCGADCSESYTGAAEVTLTAAADNGSAFLQWSGCDNAAGNTCTVAMTSNKVVGATFVPLHTLTATKSGDGAGTVTSAPGGITCGSDCGEPYPDGTVVTLTASPAQGSVFTGWSGGGCSGTGTCTVTLNGDATVTAAFTPGYSLTVTRQGGGSGTVAGDPPGINCGTECSFSYISGVQVTLTATPNHKSVFAGWTGCDTTSENTCTVTMVTNKFVYASFNPASNLRTLTVTKSGTGKGKVASSPTGINCGSDCGEKYIQGTSVTLTATPNQGSTFTGWSGGGCSGADPCVVTMNGKTTVNATFTLVPPRYTLTVTKSGTGKGKVASSPAGIDCGSDCGEKYIQGTSVTLTATPNQGFTFTGWSGGGCNGAGTCVVTMNGNTTVEAIFAVQRTLTVTKSGSGEGKVGSSPAGIDCGSDCSEKYVQGTQVTLTATPTQGSTFTGWSGGGCSGAGTCVATMNSNTTVNATFTAWHTLTVTQSGSGQGEVVSSPAGIDCGSDCSEKYVQGTQVTLNATPTQGSTFTGWSGGGCSGAGTCVATMNSETTVDAAFTKQGTDPLDTWHSRDAKTEENLWAAAYGKGTFVAVGAGGTIRSSPDGNIWTPRYAGVYGAILNVTYANGLFVAVGQHDLIVTSPDGISWTSHTGSTLPPGTYDTELYSVDYGNDTYVGVGKGSVIAISSAGKDWSLTKLSDTVDLYGIAYGKNTFVAVGANGLIMTTANGTSWQVQDSKTDENLWFVTYGKGRFVAVGDAGTILTSSDGISWKARSSGLSTPLWGVSYGNNTFVVVGPYGTLLTSLDGIAWQNRDLGVSTSLYNAAYGKQTFLLLGADGTVLQSDPLPLAPQYSLIFNDHWFPLPSTNPVRAR